MSWTNTTVNVLVLVALLGWPDSIWSSDLATEAPPSSFTVNCLNMTIERRSWDTASSRTMALDSARGTSAPRCVFHKARNINTDDPVLVAGATMAEHVLAGNSDDWVAVTVNAHGWHWISTGGSLHVDSREDGVVSGHYTATMEAVEADGVEPWRTSTVAGSTATVKGCFEWCDPHQEGGCPWGEETVSQGDFRIETAYFKGTLEGTGKVGDCLMTVDPETGGFMVDMRMAEWRGKSTQGLWAAECSAGYTIPPHPGRFHFETGGVTGPGSYGPQTSHAFMGRLLPNVTLDHPGTFTPIDEFGFACAEYLLRVHLGATDATNCVFTIERDPGRFVLDCDPIRHHDSSGPLTFDETGPFHAEMDCTYQEK